MTILAASLPPLVVLLCVMRAGAPTRPALAGAIAGMLSGALGAGAYALACKNDAGLFVALWYPLAILALAALGAALGPSRSGLVATARGTRRQEQIHAIARHDAEVEMRLVLEDRLGRREQDLGQQGTHLRELR